MASSDSAKASAMPDDLFFRHRRNLLLHSGAVIFINLLGGELTRLNVLGNELTLTNPQALPWILFVLLAYFLWRFLQYSHEVKNKGFKERFLRRVEDYLGPYLVRREYRRPDSELSRKCPDPGKIRVQDHVYMFNDAMPRNTAAVTFFVPYADISVDMNQLRVTDSELIWPFVRAAVYVTFRTRLVTDYVLPIIVGVVAFLSFLQVFPPLFVVGPTP